MTILEKIRRLDQVNQEITELKLNVQLINKKIEDIEERLKLMRVLASKQTFKSYSEFLMWLQTYKAKGGKLTDHVEILIDNITYKRPIDVLEAFEEI